MSTQAGHENSQSCLATRDWGRSTRRTHKTTWHQRLNLHLCYSNCFFPSSLVWNCTALHPTFTRSAVICFARDFHVGDEILTLTLFLHLLSELLCKLLPEIMLDQHNLAILITSVKYKPEHLQRRWWWVVNGERWIYSQLNFEGSDISVPLAFAVVSWLLAFALAFVSADGGGWSMVGDEYIHI